MWVFNSSAVVGAVCMSPNNVPMSSSPPLDTTSCCTMVRAWNLHCRYGTMLWAHRAPPHSRNTPKNWTHVITWAETSKMVFFQLQLSQWYGSLFSHQYAECAVGYYGTYNKCTACPKGTYQDTANQASCKQCENDKVTTAEASKAASACSKLTLALFTHQNFHICR